MPRLGPDSASPDVSSMVTPGRSQLLITSKVQSPPASVTSGLGLANLRLAGVLAVRGVVASPGDVVGSQDEGAVPDEVPSSASTLAGSGGLMFLTLSLNTMGSTFFRNFRFLNVTRRLPSTRTLYCLWP